MIKHISIFYLYCCLLIGLPKGLCNSNQDILSYTDNIATKTKVLDENEMPVDAAFDTREKKTPRNFLGMRGKKIPSGFMGVRGRRFEWDDDERPLSWQNFPTEDAIREYFQKEKRVPLSILGLRGRNPTSDFLRMRGRRIPVAFLGMRGKKKDENFQDDGGFTSDVNSDDNKRSPRRGFLGMRGKKEFLENDGLNGRYNFGKINNYDLIEDFNTVDKRNKLAFLGMRG